MLITGTAAEASVGRDVQDRLGPDVPCRNLVGMLDLLEFIELLAHVDLVISNDSGAGGAALVVSQFTLCADTSKGNRPSFIGAARPEEGERLYEVFCACMREAGVPVETGVFGAMMDVELVNDGPVTIVY